MKYCSELTDEICQHLKEGRTQKDACILSNINNDTFHDWLKKIEFSEKIKKAQSEFKKQLEVRVQVASNTTWTAAAWLLERRFKDDYALRQEFTGRDGESLTKFTLTLEASRILPATGNKQLPEAGSVHRLSE